MRAALLMLLLLGTASANAQTVFKVDTVLARPDRNILHYNIPEGCREVEIIHRFQVETPSLLGLYSANQEAVLAFYTARLFKKEDFYYSEYELKNRTVLYFPCPNNASIPAGEYILYLYRKGNMEAHALATGAVINNYVDSYELDRPIREVAYADTYTPNPDPEPVYKTPVAGVTSARSYIRTKGMLDASGTVCMDHIQYFDGLGRSVQTVELGASPSGADLAGFTDYGKRGQEWREWLPVPVSGMSGAFISDLPKRAAAFFGDTRPYTETLHEESPLQRPLSASGAGIAWKDRPACKDYKLNNEKGVQACNRFIVAADGTLQSAGLYETGMLEVTVTKDEDGKQLYSFKDKQERIVLERRLYGNEQADTYYVYDLKGLLRYVLPPAMNGDYSATAQERYAYRYDYDTLGRLTGSILPGNVSTVFSYDAMDRPVFVQDGNRKQAGEWDFTAYDAQGRTVCRGVFKDPSTPAGSLKGTRNYASAASGTAPESSGYSLSYDFPAGTSIRTVEYYDDYDFLNIPVFAPHVAELSWQAVTGYDTRYTASGGSIGHKTGSRMRSTDGHEILTVYYYDSKGRVVQSTGTNHLGGYDRYNYAYTLRGKMTAMRHEHTASGKVTHTEEYTYTYDHAERLLRMTHKTDARAAVTLAAYEYDETGRLKVKTLHGLESVKMNYAYNLRGWLTGIGNGKFTQNLYYADGAGTPCYNGNISSMTWKAGDGTLRGYKYAYDDLNRLTAATYGEGTSISGNPDRFTEKVTSYDKNGNILSLQRYGQTSASGYGMMDNLSFTPNGNRLNRVDDAVGTAAYAGGFEFKDGVKQADEYAYDANGNLTKDLNKGITDIQYNFLNLPNKVTFSDGSTITYTYTADGTKLRTVCMIGGVTTTTDYLGNVIYENGVAKLLLTEAGYVSLADGKYHYYLQDHQGNNRVVINESGSVEEVNHYYPFGGIFASSGNVQPYKYNGKELDTKKGLNWYDYGARHYDAAVGRFTTVDPMAEKYYSTSPYTYCINNPIMHIDPTGMLISPIYDRNGKLLGTDDEGLKGKAIIMDKSNFKQGMSHEEALGYSLGYKGLSNNEARSNYITSYTGLKDRPDYDGFVTIDEGVSWAKSHPNALDSPTPENSLYINTALLDFGDLTVDKIGIRNIGKIMPVNLFTKSNTKEAIVNKRLRATVYALGTVDVILHNPVMRTISIVNNNATDYDWNGGGSFIRNAAIQLELIRSGLSNIHGFKTYYYGIGRLRK